MHVYADPARFLKIARPLTAWLGWIGAALIARRAWLRACSIAPARAAPGRERAHHLPPRSRRLARHGAAGPAIAAASLMQLVWRHPLAAVAARAVAVPGAVFAFICLATGSLWGRPTWGTYWEWDGRMTSMLVLLFLYHRLYRRCRRRERGRKGRITAIFGLVGAVQPADHPLSRCSGGRTLHQGQSIRFPARHLDDRRVDALAACWPRRSASPCCSARSC